VGKKATKEKKNGRIEERKLAQRESSPRRKQEKSNGAPTISTLEIIFSNTAQPTDKFVYPNLVETEDDFFFID
jgi:hypothetical protein